jgi:hypothetical protein
MAGMNEIARSVLKRARNIVAKVNRALKIPKYSSLEYFGRSRRRTGDGRPMIDELR